ncbi:MAG: thymidine phosphorylase [Bacteroidota bacterium]
MLPMDAPLDTVRLLVQKRDGHRLDPDVIEALIAAYTEGSVPDYQMAAFLMAAFLNGLDREEAAALARAMLYSGTVLDLGDVAGVKVDKHSTGGVGDGTSLVLAPLVAACGVPVPMISGRGLGHSGGTLDKLESIPGFRTDLSIPDYRDQLARIGVVMIGQTAEIAPADKKLYALRDVTATVESIPFIAASIMSKKLAEGIDALVLDVKQGRGAFMKTEADARRLAETLVGIGLEFDTPTVARLTAMEQPLAPAAGNWPEVVCALRCLRGEAIRLDQRFLDVTLELAGEMLALGGVADTPKAGRARAEAAIADGSAFEKLLHLADAQGADVAALEAPERRPGNAPVAEVRAPDTLPGGTFVSSIDALALGWAAVRLGAGRRTKEDAVDPVAGIALNKQVGDPVEAGELLATIHAADTARVDQDAIGAAFAFADAAPGPLPLLLDRFDGVRWGSDSSDA